MRTTLQPSCTAAARSDVLTVRRCPPCRIAGLIPEPVRRRTDEDQQALNERAPLTSDASPTSSNALGATMNAGSPRSVLNQRKRYRDTRGVPLNAQSPPTATATASSVPHHSARTQVISTRKLSMQPAPLWALCQTTRPRPGSQALLRHAVHRHVTPGLVHFKYFGSCRFVCRWGSGCRPGKGHTGRLPAAGTVDAQVRIKASRA